MKKKLLFVLPSLCSGGAEKSLVTLLHVLEPAAYDVSVFLFRAEGLFLSQLPSNVRLLEAGEDYRMFDGSAAAALKYFIKKRKFRSAFARIDLILAAKRGDAARVWRDLQTTLPPLQETYDAAIGYLEGTATYFAVDKVQAKRKIAFLHTDYSRMASQQAADAPYYEKIDALIGVSPLCCETAEQFFPCLKGKTAVMENIVSPALIRSMAQVEIDDMPDGGVPRLLTVGRCVPVKGIDLAVEACAVLKEKGVRLRWYHIGQGAQQEALRAAVRDKGLEDTFLFLGERENPYPYLRACDVYVQPSRAEGKSIAIDEAKCLAKPIVVTGFPTVYDQIENGVNGLITEAITAQAIADKIEQLLSDDALRQRLTRALENEATGNETQAQVLCDLIEG